MDHQPQIFEDVVDINNVRLGETNKKSLQVIHRFDIYKVKLMDTIQIQTGNEKHNINSFILVD